MTARFSEFSILTQTFEAFFLVSSQIYTNRATDLKMYIRASEIQYYLQNSSQNESC